MTDGFAEKGLTQRTQSRRGIAKARRRLNQAVRALLFLRIDAVAPVAGSTVEVRDGDADDAVGAFDVDEGVGKTFKSVAARAVKVTCPTIRASFDLLLCPNQFFFEVCCGSSTTLGIPIDRGNHFGLRFGMELNFRSAAPFGLLPRTRLRESS